MSRPEIPAWILVPKKPRPQSRPNGVMRMEEQKNTNGNWIGALVTELNLIKEKESLTDLNRFRAQLEDSQLLERIRKAVADINAEVGYSVLDLMEFLSPQRSVLRLSYSTNKTEYILEIVIRRNGPAVVFHSVDKGSDRWNWYLHGRASSRGSSIALNHNFNPTEITEQIIRTWFAFLLSGFNNKFKPKVSTGTSENREFRMFDILGKTSA
jgi:hypothetical protein